MPLSEPEPLLLEPLLLDPLPDFVPEEPPAMVVVVALVAPRCDASKPKSSTNAETVLRTQ